MSSTRHHTPYSVSYRKREKIFHKHSMALHKKCSMQSIVVYFHLLFINQQENSTANKNKNRNNNKKKIRNVSPSQTEVNVFDFRLFQVHIGQHEKINNKQCGSNTPCVYLHTEHQPIQHENHHLFKCSYRIVVQRMKNDI